jgi:hypothetical protein
MAGKYAAFTEEGPYMKKTAGRSGIARAYIEVTCPRCEVMFLDLTLEQLGSSKASKCKQHLDSGCVWQSVRGPRLPPQAEAQPDAPTLVDATAVAVDARAPQERADDALGDVRRELTEQKERTQKLHETLSRLQADREQEQLQNRQYRALVDCILRMMALPYPQPIADVRSSIERQYDEFFKRMTNAEATSQRLLEENKELKKRKRSTPDAEDVETLKTQNKRLKTENEATTGMFRALCGSKRVLKHLQVACHGDKASQETPAVRAAMQRLQTLVAEANKR